jgi:hypothetical protein
MHSMSLIITAKPVQSAGRPYVKVRLGDIPPFTLSEQNANEFVNALSGFSAAPIHTNLDVELIIEDQGDQMVLRMQKWTQVLTRDDACRLKALMTPASLSRHSGL